MDSITSRSMSQPSESVLATRSARMMLLGKRYNIYLIATCLFNAFISPMNVSEIYEWLAEKYLCYQYIKFKVCKVLEHDSKRKTFRFVIINKNRMAGVL